MKISLSNINSNKTTFKKKDSMSSIQNEIKDPKVFNTYNLNFLGNDEIKLSTAKNCHTPSFRGFLGDLFGKKEDITIKSSKLTPDEIVKKKNYVANEIQQILLDEKNGISEKKNKENLEKLKEMMNSEYLDYQIELENGKTLNDYVLRFYEYRPKDVYNYFLIESLSKHNNQIDLDKDFMAICNIETLLKKRGEAGIANDYDYGYDFCGEPAKQVAEKAEEGLIFLLNHKYGISRVNERKNILGRIFDNNSHFLYNECKYEMPIRRILINPKLNYDNFEIEDLYTCLKNYPDFSSRISLNYVVDRITDELQKEPHRIVSPFKLTSKDRAINDFLEEYFRKDENRTVENVINLVKKICLPYNKDISTIRYYDYIATPIFKCSSLGAKNIISDFCKNLEQQAIENGKVCQGDELDEYGIAIVDTIFNACHHFNIPKDSLDGKLYNQYKDALEINKSLSRNELYNLSLAMVKDYANTSNETKQSLDELLSLAKALYGIKNKDNIKLAEKLLENNNAFLLKTMLDKKLIKDSDIIRTQDGYVRVDSACLLSEDENVNKLFNLSDVINKVFNDTKEEKSFDIPIIKGQILDKMSVPEFINAINDVIDTQDFAPYRLYLANLIAIRLNSSKLKQTENDMLLNVAQKLLLTEDKRVSEDTLINENTSILNRILENTLKPSPEIIKIINHPKVDINKKINNRFPSILANSFNNVYLSDINLQILIDAAKRNDFTSVSKELPNFGLNGLQRLNLEELIKNKPELHKDIANLYKKVADCNGKINFYQIAKNKNFVKHLKDAGIDINKSYGDDSLFISLIRQGVTSALDELSVQKLIEEALKIDDRYIQIKYFNKALLRTTTLNDYDSLYNSYVNIKNTINDIIAKKKNSTDNNKDQNNKYLHTLNDALMQIASDWEIGHQKVQPQILDLANKYKSANSLSEQETLLDKMLILWYATDNLKELCTNELIDALLPVGVSNFRYPKELIGDITRKSLAYYIKQNPDVADGICTMSEIYNALMRDKSFLKDGGNVLNLEINDNKETLLDIYFGVTKETEEDKKLDEKLINSLLNTYPIIDLEHKDINGSNYALKAVQSENVKFIEKLLSDKDFDGWTETNKFGQSAISEALNSPNPQIRTMFKDKKFESQELINYANMGSSIAVQKLLQNPFIDVNTTDTYLETAWLIAARNRDESLVDVLKERDDVNYSQVNYDGKNFLLLAIEQTLKDEKTEFLSNVINKLSATQLGLNDIITLNGKSYSVYEYLYKKYCEDNWYYRPNLQKLLKLFLSHKESNPNISSNGAEPLAFKFIKRNDLYNFKILVESGKLDPNLKYKGKSLIDAIENNNLYVRDKKEYLELLKKASIMSQQKDVKEFIDKYGMLSLENISEILKYPNAEMLLSTRFGYNDETIAHLLLDIPLDEKNMLEMIKLTKEMLKINNGAFILKDRFNQSTFEKAVLAENDVVLELITKNRRFTKKEKDKLLNLAQQVNNENIKRLVKNIAVVE